MNLLALAVRGAGVLARQTKFCKDGAGRVSFEPVPFPAVMELTLYFTPGGLNVHVFRSVRGGAVAYLVGSFAADA